MSGQTNSSVGYDVPQQKAASFRPIEIKRQKVTTSSFLLTLTALQDVATVNLKLSGTTAELHPDEMKLDPAWRNFAALKTGQRPQFAGEITTANGQSGQITISGTALDAGASTASPPIHADVPFQNQKGQLKLGKVNGIGPLTVAAKATSQTVSDGYVVKGDVTVSLKAVSNVPPVGMTVEVSAEGITLVASEVPASQPQSSTEVARSITFVARDGQKGRILTQISGKTTTGKNYVRRAYLYVLAAPTQLFTSTSGFVDLEIQKLKADLTAHLISNEQYDVALTAILSGATESGVSK
jgi:hypothetical protein